MTGEIKTPYFDETDDRYRERVRLWMSDQEIKHWSMKEKLRLECGMVKQEKKVERDDR